MRYGSGKVLPSVSAAAVQAMLDELGQAVASVVHAVVLMDRAGWHGAKGRWSSCTRMRPS